MTAEGTGPQGVFHGRATLKVLNVCSILFKKAKKRIYFRMFLQRITRLLQKFVIVPYTYIGLMSLKAGGFKFLKFRPMKGGRQCL